MTGQKPKTIHNRHEKWCLEVVLPLLGKVQPHRVYNQILVLDAAIAIHSQTHRWAELAPVLEGRETLIEHFSKSVSYYDYTTCVMKIAQATRDFERLPKKHRGGRKSPILVILSHQQPDALLERGVFWATPTTGIWVCPTLDTLGIILVVTTRLPDSSVYDALRISTRTPADDDAYLRTVSLVESMDLDYTTRVNLTEAMMEFFIEGKTPLALMAELRELKDQMRAVKDQKRAAEEEKRAAEEEKRAAEEEKRAAEEQKRAAEHRMEAMQREIEALKRRLGED